MWKVELSEEAFRDLSKLDNAVAKRIVTKLEEASANPDHYLTRLTGYDDCKLRIGDYRIILILNRSKEIIFVEKIGHRKNVYK